MIQSRILYSTSEISSTLAISKYRGEKGEKETAEIEKNPHRSVGMNTGKDFIFSKKGYLAIKPCCRADCTNNALLSTGDTKSFKRQLSKVSN